MGPRLTYEDRKILLAGRPSPLFGKDSSPSPPLLVSSLTSQLEADGKVLGEHHKTTAKKNIYHLIKPRKMVALSCIMALLGAASSAHAFQPLIGTPARLLATSLGASPLSLDNELTTVISLYPTSDEESHASLARILMDKVLPEVSSQEGFVSAHLHKSLDGAKIGVYEQWASEDAHQNFLENSDLQDKLEDMLLESSSQQDPIDRHVYHIVTSESNLDQKASVSKDYPLVHFAEFHMIPENQDRMVALAKENIRPAMKIPGLLTATFHRSLDGTRVINYGQWENEQAIENLKKQPGFSSAEPYWEGVAENEHHLYRLVASFELKHA